MPLSYYPSAGEILLCNFDTGFISPEMTKLRPVVIISPRLRRVNKLVTVVSLSTTQPTIIEPYHFELTLETPLPHPFDAKSMWIKGDMIARVSIDRLDRFRAGRNSSTYKRVFVSGKVTPEQFKEIRERVLIALGFR